MVEPQFDRVRRWTGDLRHQARRNRTEVLLEGQGQSWAPNGHDLWSWFLYYDEFLEDYYTGFQTLNVETGAYTTSNVGGHVIDPVVSPDGEALVYTTLGAVIRPTSRTAPEGHPIGNWGSGDWQPLPVNTPSTPRAPDRRLARQRLARARLRECYGRGQPHARPAALTSPPAPRPSRPRRTSRSGVPGGDRPVQAPRCGCAAAVGRARPGALTTPTCACEAASRT